MTRSLLTNWVSMSTTPDMTEATQKLQCSPRPPTWQSPLPRHAQRSRGADSRACCFHRTHNHTGIEHQHQPAPVVELLSTMGKGVVPQPRASFIPGGVLQRSIHARRQLDLSANLAAVVLDPPVTVVPAALNPAGSLQLSCHCRQQQHVGRWPVACGQAVAQPQVSPGPCRPGQRWRAGWVLQPGLLAQGPPALHQRWNADNNPGQPHHPDQCTHPGSTAQPGFTTVHRHQVAQPSNYDTAPTLSAGARTQSRHMQGKSWGRRSGGAAPPTEMQFKAPEP